MRWLQVHPLRRLWKRTWKRSGVSFGLLNLQKDFDPVPAPEGSKKRKLEEASVLPGMPESLLKIVHGKALAAAAEGLLSIIPKKVVFLIALQSLIFCLPVFLLGSVSSAPRSGCWCRCRCEAQAHRKVHVLLLWGPSVDLEFCWFGRFADPV